VVLADIRAAAHIYRITQEAVSNAVRHGKAKLVVIKLATEGSRVVLTIKDNGEGVLENLKPTGIGLRTMNYRARAIGGSLDIQQRQHGGIAVTCSFPNEYGAGAEKADH
jgi:signal transduction histidine kinase